MPSPIPTPRAQSLPYRTTTVPLEEIPYLSLSDDIPIDTGVGASLCKGHGENVRCDNCKGGRGDGVGSDEVGGGGEMAVGIAGRGEGAGMCDSDDEDEDAGEEEAVVGRESPAFTSPVIVMPDDESGARMEGMVPLHPSPLAPGFTSLPPVLGGESFPGAVFVADETGPGDSIMPDLCVDMEGCDSGYESALEGGWSCKLADNNANPGNRRCESPVDGIGEGAYKALYQQLKEPGEAIGAGLHRWTTPQSSCGELSSPCESDDEDISGKRPGHSGMMVAAQGEAKGRVKRSGGMGLMGGGQKKGKVRKGRGEGKTVWRKRSGGGYAGVKWVS